ncbi:hypothetical protein HYFRA_00000635 [Hymenoscyphus fraxineus]|uniref:Acyltransferase MbtK/IucB-like conserved domain-containing protein n=1 Tax=Hymenoscyphus fraxineus TaxID=746836 RepID=A0A9N9PWG6_9HELO|nr:hypothetical protein HYFRA_00000635 [Hymenoscyphus fraxineus]
MAPPPYLVQLPNGQTLTVSSVFGGFFFKANGINQHNNIFPAGWTVILNTEYSDDEITTKRTDPELRGMPPKGKPRHIHAFKQPTLRNDNLFISSISNPSSIDFKSPTGPTRQIAMMLWATLEWYFHQPEPNLRPHTEATKDVPEAARPKADWRINIRREGVFRGRNLIQKLERMGLVTSEDSSVGEEPEENTPHGWSQMFSSRRIFWQLSAKLFLFTIAPTVASSFPGSPYGSRPNSPVRGDHKNGSTSRRESPDRDTIARGLPSPGLPPPQGGSATITPFTSGSHLPTYYPPPPLQYTMTSGVRHPNRPKPPRQGEIFYTRYIRSIGQYLAFRVASLSTRPVAYNGPSTVPNFHRHHHHHTTASLSSLPAHISISSMADVAPPSPSISEQNEETTSMTDLQLLTKWMNNPRVSKFWGLQGPQNIQEEYLRKCLTSKHSFPAIGLWDGKPFGFFEIYWTKEDVLGRHLGCEAGDFDRGFHVLVGEQEFRGKHRVDAWATSIAHWAFVQDYRTNSVVLEPRVDNERFISHLQSNGFFKEKEITFSHKQSAYMKLRRENFEAPAL